MSSDVTQLKNRLKHLLSRLEAYDVALEDEFMALSVAWDRLDRAWDGVAYQEFIQSWRQAQSMFREYASIASKYEMFLRERIEALERFERSGGL